LEEEKSKKRREKKSFSYIFGCGFAASGDGSIMISNSWELFRIFTISMSHDDQLPGESKEERVKS
jgi:hypothetical protein